MPNQYTGPSDAVQRFWSKVDQNGPIPEHRPDLGPCWIWIGSKAGKGYGSFFFDGKTVYAHRFAREMLVGPIEKRDVDHLCRVISCIRPDHTEPVTHQENIARGNSGQAWAEIQRAKTVCPAGHPYEGDNLLVSPSGWRKCRTCSNKASRDHKARRRACQE